MPRNRTQRRAAAAALSRVKEDENDGDSEWEQSSQQDDEESSSFEDEDTTSQASEEEEEAQQKKKAAAKPKKTPSKNSKKRKADESDDNADSDDDSLLPTYARKTAKGGYSHTSKSRARISQANKGNTPWNKGKNRSDSVKAKISAGVRARNRAVLLAKLKKLNMTEAEWDEKKKEIKYLREKVRVAKKAAEARDATRKKGRDTDKTYEELQKQLAQKLEEQKKMNAIKQEDDEEEQQVAKPCRKKKQDKKISAQKKQDLLKKVFKPHVNWAKHDYDTHDGLYEQLCPTGGPGGLTCCEVCSSAFSRYLNQTSRDVEIQSIHNAGKEVEECIGFMKETRDKLHDKMEVARRQAPPLKHDVAV